MTTTLTAVAGLTEAESRDDLAQSIEPLLPSTALAGLGRRSVASDAASSLAGELDDPLDQIVVRACERDADAKARCRSAAAGQKGQLVEVSLGQQTISYVETPRIELEVAGKKHPLLELTLEVELAVTMLQLDVLDGKVVRVHPTDAVVGVVVEAAGVELSRRESLPVLLGARPIDP